MTAPDAASARPAHLGLHHVALFVADLDAARHFWVDLLGFVIEWQPDPDNLYLCSGSDNLALHRAPPVAASGAANAQERLDHVGIIARDPATVDAWHAWLLRHQVTILAAPRRHRDGAYSLYCQDPNGVRVQIIHHPPIIPALNAAAAIPRAVAP